jgi:hypothetical protein
MTNETSLPGWPPRPQTWPRWPPDASWNGGLMSPAVPNDPVGVQSGPVWVETPSGGLLALHPNGANWVETPNGGLLAVHPQPRVPSERGGSHWWDSIASAPAMPGAGGWPSPSPTSEAPPSDIRKGGVLESLPAPPPESFDLLPDTNATTRRPVAATDEAQTGSIAESSDYSQAAGRSGNINHCVPLYVRCQHLHGGKMLRNGKRCEDCLNMCTLYGEWPFGYCPLPG